MDEITHLKIRLESLKSTLNDYPPKDRSKPITKRMATHFNEIRQSIVQIRPQLEQMLPKEIALTIKNEYTFYDHPEANYFDLQTFSNEVIGILAHLESGN